MEGCAAMAARPFEGYGFERSDIDVAMIYDDVLPDVFPATRGSRVLWSR